MMSHKWKKKTNYGASKREWEGVILRREAHKRGKGGE